MGKRKGEATMTLLPTLLDENRAINQAAFWILMARHNMEKEYSRECLKTRQLRGPGRRRRR